MNLLQTRTGLAQPLKAVLLSGIWACRNEALGIRGSVSLNAFRKLILHGMSIVSLEHLCQNQQVNPNHDISSQFKGNRWHPGFSGTRLFLIKHSKDLQLPKKEDEEGFTSWAAQICEWRSR